MTRHLFVILAALPFVGAAPSAPSRFVQVEGPHLVAPGGSKLLLKGINLGNWLVPEGYMFHFDSWPTSSREIATLFNELVGPIEVGRFWTTYRDQYIQEADIQFLKRAGFNSVRIPFDAGPLSEGREFDLLDRTIAWCRRAGLWVILDMHCAPGGQTGANIDNSWGYPWLFEDAEYQRRTSSSLARNCAPLPERTRRPRVRSAERADPNFSGTPAFEPTPGTLV